MPSLGRKKKLAYVKLKEVSYFCSTVEINCFKHILNIFDHIAINITRTGSNISYQKIAKQRNRDKNL